MPREIRSAPLRYGLATASFALILGAFVWPSVCPSVPHRPDVYKKPVDPTKLAAAVASLGKKSKE